MKKRWISLVLVLCMVVFLPVTARADDATSGTFENILWEFDGATGTLTISGTGDMPNSVRDYNYAPWYDAHLTVHVKHVVIREGVTSIGDYAFIYMDNMETVSIPSTVKRIGVGAFYQCMKLKEVKLPEGLTTLESKAFAECMELQKINIPDGITLIPGSCFELCNLQTVEVGPNCQVTDIASWAFHCNFGITEMPAFPKLRQIGDNAFRSTGLTVAEFPETVTYIGRDAFMECMFLNRIVFRGDAPELEENCFQGVSADAMYPANNPTWTEDKKQGYGGVLIWMVAHEHEYSYYPITQPTCTQPGESEGVCNICEYPITVTTPALGHDYSENPVYNPENRTHEAGCSRCDRVKTENCTFGEGVVAQAAAPDARGTLRYSCTICGGSYEEPYILRLSGANRYETAFLTADTLKAQLGVEKFANIIVASGLDFPDALAGSYLAAVKNAPILLVNRHFMDEVADYIGRNLAEGGTVYLLGGETAVSGEMEGMLADYAVKRLAGANRLGTNLEILAEAGAGDGEILVCTGWGFADSLAASAVGKPILLVNNRGLTQEQKDFLAESDRKFVIIGGESAVSPAIAEALAVYGDVERLSGANRYETSVAVAKRFFETPETAILAYAQNFPDGLCGGPLACRLNAPLLLIASNRGPGVVSYAREQGIGAGAVLGGEGLIDEATVNSVFFG